MASPLSTAAVIGAGQMGLTIAAGLSECVGRVALFDRATAGFEAPRSPSRACKRCVRLNSSRGTELGLLSFGFRAW